MTERGEYRFNTRNAEQQVSDVIQAVGFEYRLDTLAHILIQERESGLRIGAYSQLHTPGSTREAFTASVDEMGVVRTGIKAIQVVDMLLRQQPGVPLLCDRIMGEALEPYFDRDNKGTHPTITRNGKTCDIYVPRMTLKTIAHLGPLTNY